MTTDKIAHKIGLLHSSSTETPTSFELCRLIVSQIPGDWESPDFKFLDPCCGRGNMLLAAAERLEKIGHAKEHIVKNMLHGCDISKVQSMIARKALHLYYPTDNNISNNNALIKEWNMKFSVVVGNPPYQEGGRDDQANKLWPQFVKKAYDLVEDDGYVAMITPNGWMQPTADIGKGTGKNALSIFNDLFKKNNLILANVDSDNIRENYFKGVGSTFSYYIFQKAPYSGGTEFITPTGSVTVDINTVQSLPKIVSKESLSIVNKMSGTPFTFCDQNHGLNGHEGDTQGIYTHVKKTKNGEKISTHDLVHSIYHTNKNNGTYWFGEKPNPYANKPKVIISLSGTYLPVFNNTNGFSNMCLAVICNTDDEAYCVQKILSSKLYKFWVDMQKFSGFNPRKLILTLPSLPLTQDWDDAKIYKHFNLTREEIDYINNNTK